MKDLEEDSQYYVKQVWPYVHIILACWTQMQGDQKFKAVGLEKWLNSKEHEPLSQRIQVAHNHL